jgi:hypothetical protein
MGKPVFWREFWLLWSAGAITTATFAALVEIPTTPLAGFLLLRGHSEKALLVGTEAMEITIGLAIAVSCGLLAAHRIGLGAPIVERWLSGEPIKSQVRALLVPCLVVGISIAVISMLSNLPVFHPNRQLARQEAQRISESPSAARVGEKLGTFTGKRLTLASLTVSYLSGAIEGELIARLFLLSGIALILAKITRTPSGAVGDGILFSAVFAVAAISTIDYLAWQAAASQMIFTSVGITTVVHDPLWVVITRALLRTVPGAVGFGWLYVRRGIESAILGAFIASVVAHVLLVIAVVHLV